MPKSPQEFYLTMGGRRFLMAIGAGVTATWLQYMGKLDPAGSSYALIVLGCVGAYIAGATHEAVKGLGKE